MVTQCMDAQSGLKGRPSLWLCRVLSPLEQLETENALVMCSSFRLPFNKCLLNFTSFSFLITTSISQYNHRRTENVETLFDTNVWPRTWSLLPFDDVLWLSCKILWACGHLNLLGPVGLNSLSTPESDPRYKNAQKNDLVVKTALRIK